MNSIGCPWNSAANTRSQLLPTVTTTVHFPLTFQLLSARIRLHASCDHRTKNSWKSLNTASNLLTTVLSVSLPHLSGIRCLPACGISPSCLTSKPSSKLSFFNRHFHKSTRTMMCECRRGKLYLCLCVYLREWFVIAHWVFLTRRFALYKSHPLLLLLLLNPRLHHSNTDDWVHIVCMLNYQLKARMFCETPLKVLDNIQGESRKFLRHYGMNSDGIAVQFIL